MGYEIPKRTYGRRLEEITRRFPNKTAFQVKTPAGRRDITYQEFERQSRGVAMGLTALGLERETRVAILTENRPEWAVAYLGIIFAGGIAVPLDAQISPAEWRNLLQDSESRYIFVSDMFLPRLREAIAGTPLADHLIRLDGAPKDKDEEGSRSLAQLIDWSYSLEPAPVLEERALSDVMVIIYTSGTTGKPKGVMLTQDNIVSEIVSAMAAVRADENDTLLCLLPLHHVFASVVNVLLPVYLGAQVNFVDTLKRAEILEALEEGKITILATVPQFFYLFHRRIEEELAKKPAAVRAAFHWLRLLNRFCLRALRVNLGKVLFGRIHRYFGSRLRLFVSAGSSFDSKVAQEFYDYGFTILQGYGLTETAGGVTITRVENNVIGSVGPVIPPCEIRIADPDEAGVGEIAVRGPLVMAGYYKDAAATAEVIRDGWFYSGDLGWLDSNGNLFVTGRKKEIIVPPSGKNIYPDELEVHYGQCPYIQEIAVLGIAATDRGVHGEKLHAVIVPNFDLLKEQRIANAREIIRDEVARWSNRLPKYKRLMSYQIQAEPLPRTTTRKIKRLELKRLIESGALREPESSRPTTPVQTDDQELLESVVGREVINCIRNTYQRQQEISLDMNLELDLGFDSMERVELLTSIEQALGLRLADDFGADIFTVRDLISRLQILVSVTPGGSAERQGWDKILSAEALASDEEAKITFSGPALTVFKYLLMRMVYLLLRVLLRLEIRGLGNLPRRGAFLLCPNHLSYTDPFVVMCALPYRVFKRVFFVGYSAFFKNRIMKQCARLAGIVPVDPDANLLRAMKVGAWGLQRGHVLCIFPEGSRSFDGELQEFRKGAAILARETDAPIIPIGLRGTYEVWARDSRRIRLHKVAVQFGELLQAGSDSYQEYTDRLRDAVARLVR